MHAIQSGQESESAAVFEVAGEPATVINGVPALPAGSQIPGFSETTINLGPNSDPHFGEWMEGRKIRKLFGKEYYSGKVAKFDHESNWYQVIYEDGDAEDLEWHELEEVLLPLDISFPLTALALQRCKSERSASMPKSILSRTRKGDNKGVVSMEKKVELSQTPYTGGWKGEKSLDLNFSKNPQDNLQSEILVPVTIGVWKPQGLTSDPVNYASAEIKVQVLDSSLRPSEIDSIKGERALKIDPNEEIIAKEAYKNQRVKQKHNLSTAKAEKQKRKENLLIQGTAFGLNNISQ